MIKVMYKSENDGKQNVFLSNRNRVTQTSSSHYCCQRFHNKN